MNLNAHWHISEQTRRLVSSGASMHPAWRNWLVCPDGRITRIFLACTVNDNTPFYTHRLGSNLTQFYLSYYFVDLIAQKDLPTQDAKNHPRANEISCGVPQTSTLFYFFSHFTLTILTMLLVYSIWYCVRRRFMSQKRSRLSFRYVNLEMGKLSVSFIAN